MKELPWLKRVVGGRAKELFWIFFNLGKELLHIQGNALDLAGFGEKAHDMAIP